MIAAFTCGAWSRLHGRLAYGPGGVRGLCPPARASGSLTPEARRDHVIEDHQHRTIGEERSYARQVGSSESNG